MLIKPIIIPRIFKNRVAVKPNLIALFWCKVFGLKGAVFKDFF